MQLVATTLQGLEQVLAEEIRFLGAEDIRIGKRAVEFTGDQYTLYAANVYCTTALRILKNIKVFQARTPEELYTLSKEVNWEEFLHADQTFAIDFTVHSPYFTHSQYAALKLKDAIADRFRERLGRRPSVDTKAPHIYIHLRIDQDQVFLSLNSSGESLHRRGYRGQQHKAPLSEVLAAGMIRLTGWDGKTPFYDPMCGSGTLPIEAAMLADHLAPGLLGRKYAFQHWPDYHEKLFRQILLDAQKQVLTTEKSMIFASDTDHKSYSLSKENAQRAKLDHRIHFFLSSFEKASPPPVAGTLIMNPPYGERLPHADLVSFYKAIGDVMKQRYQGWQVWILTANLEAAKFIGLRPSRKIQLFNGPMECRFFRYDMYAGSKKTLSQDTP